MKILITYFSETGNTKKVAEAIAGAVETAAQEVVVSSLQDANPASLQGFDLVFVGSTCHSSDIAAPVKQWLDRIPSEATSNLAGFVTHSATMPEGAAWEKQMYERWAGRCLGSFEHACANKGFRFLGFFHCQGAPSPEIEVFIRTNIVPDDAQWNTYINEVRQHPTSADLEAAKEFAEKVLVTIQG